jgi:Nodulation protein Z (NodZ)
MLRRLRNVVRDPTILPRYLRARRKLLRLRYRERHNHGVISVEMYSTNGMFAQLTWCLYIFAYCDERRLIPHVILTSPNYVNPGVGPDWFQYFFEQYQGAFVRENVVTTVRTRTPHDLGLPTRCFADMTIERAARLARQYLIVRPEITAAVHAFAAAHFTGRVLGVHYRGTDKEKSEAPRVPYDEVSRAVRAHLECAPDVGCLFVASDEAAFLDHIRRERVGVPICCCDDLRSSSAMAIHRPTFPGDPYRKGREALVNALLLARCDHLIRTTSTLSAWASIFNPGLPVTLLNEPYAQACWFPEREIVKRARQKAVLA